MSRFIASSVIILSILLTAPLAALAQTNGGQRIAVPLTDPSKPVELSVSLVTGGIEVSAYDGNEVIVLARPRAKLEQQSTDEGMRVIPNTSLGLTAEEKENRVSVDTEWTSRPIDLEIQVPKRTSARLSTVNSGHIVVRGLTGDLELQNVNGEIEADSIKGSVVADTTNGDVRVSFVEVSQDREMAFSSFNGNVELTFPASLAADFKISAGRGDIRTNFDVEQQPVEPRVERDNSGGSYRVRVSNEVHLKIGRGGPVYRVETFNGDVSILKAM
jgi:hypothetical protein